MDPDKNKMRMLRVSYQGAYNLTRLGRYTEAAAYASNLAILLNYWGKKKVNGGAVRVKNKKVKI